MSKTIKNVYDKSLTYHKLFNAYKNACIGKGNKKNVLMYSKDVERNIIKIKSELENSNYKIGSYNTFVIYEPKIRIIKALPFKDRIVQQWYIKEFIKPYILPRFIYDSYACIDGKGTHKAVDRLQYFMNKMKINNNYYVLKCDIRKFFNNIDKDILFHIMKKYISDSKLLLLTSILIFDDNSNKGLAIGNYTSQYFANIYLNELDYFVKYDLKIKYYIRYMDDFVILLDNKEECKFIKNKIEIFLKEKLNLELNNRSIYFPSRLGIDFCGYRIFNDYRLVRKRCIRKINTCIKKWNKLAINKKLDIKKMDLSINSIYGHIKHGNCFRLKKKINYERNEILKKILVNFDIF